MTEIPPPPPSAAPSLPPPPPLYAQPPTAPYGYAAPAQAPYYGPDPRTAKNWMNVVSFIASITTIFTGIGAIVGIVFGHLGLAAVKRGEANNKGFGTAGLIIGYGSIALGVLAFLAWIVFFVAVAASGASTSP